jgi:NADPH-dependent glutamate synthase beta subunit-like oxidoreductase
MALQGSELDGVVKAIDYLLNINRGYRVPLGKRVVVIGGGLVALDAARTAIRAILPGLSMAPDDEAVVIASTMRIALDAAREAARRDAAEVTVVSLESATEMPAGRSVQGQEELDVAREEGIRLLPSWGPLRVLGSGGRVSGIELVRCVSAFDQDGRFNPVFDPAETRVLDADTVILAIGQAPDLSFIRSEDGIEVTRAGSIKIDPTTLATTAPGVFAGGDAAFPPALLITAAQQGKVAARSIDAYLRGGPLLRTELRVSVEELATDTYRMTPRYETIERRIPILPLERRSGINEVELRLTEADAREQAQRCLYCHTHPIYDGERCILCNRCADICPEHCIRFAPPEALETAPETRQALAERGGGSASTVFLYDEEKCIRCGLCAIRCPTAAITMQRFHFAEVSRDG